MPQGKLFEKLIKVFKALFDALAFLGMSVGEDWNPLCRLILLPLLLIRMAALKRRGNIP